MRVTRTGRKAVDEGMTLIEVVVALLVFAIISTGILAAMATISRMTTDDRARVTAENLATREIDRMRALGDPFKVMAATSTADRTGVDYVVDGRTYTITRNVSWVSQTGADVPCSSGSSLFYARINVRVTWPGMLSNTAPVQDDTLMAPTSSLTSDSTGAISVSVVDDLSQGQSNVVVTVAANTGGTTPSKQPANTDSAGCSYIGNIAPGNYTVTISKQGWIDSQQNSTFTSQPFGVTQGSTNSPTLNPYAQAASVVTNYKPGPVAYSGSAGSILVPNSIPTVFTNTYGTWPTSTSTQAAAVARYPYSSGYSTIFGQLQSGSSTCSAVDPQSWTAAKVNGVDLNGGVRGTAASAAGQSSTSDIPVGVVLVKAPAGQYVAATQAAPATGNPSCGITGSVYVSPALATGSLQAIALPYGSWKLYTGTSYTNAVVLGPSSVQVVTNTTGGTVAADGTFTLDPRAAK